MRLGSDELQLSADETEIVFVRHGVSLNNVFKDAPATNVLLAAGIKRRLAMGSTEEVHWNIASASKFERGYEQVCHGDGLCGNYSSLAPSSLNWEMSRSSRDCLLHPDGEAIALELQRTLLGILPEDLQLHGFFVSPLRRTLQTLLAAFGGMLQRAPPGTPVAVQPWMHERYKSLSDLASDGELNARFLDRYLEHIEKALGQQGLRGAVDSLQQGLRTLGTDWVDKLGRTHPNTTALEAPIDSAHAGSMGGGTMPFYPRTWYNTYYESDAQVQARMTVLRRWLKLLPPGRRYVLVGHGNVGLALFERKLENLAVVTARFRPSSAKAEDGAGFFHDVKLGRERWHCSKLPGWRAK